MSNCLESIDTKFFKSLSEKNRVSLLSRLCNCEEPQSVREMAKCCDVDVSVVSRHLSLMKDAGIIHAEKVGKEVRYSVNREQVVHWLRSLANFIENCCPKTKQRSKP